MNTAGTQGIHALRLDQPVRRLHDLVELRSAAGRSVTTNDSALFRSSPAAIL